MTKHTKEWNLQQNLFFLIYNSKTPLMAALQNGSSLGLVLGER
jgi:hypothetical protein